MDGAVSMSILPIKQTVTLLFSFTEILYEEDDNCSDFVMSDLGSWGIMCDIFIKHSICQVSGASCT